MVSSINTNIAAYFAQGNIGRASDNASASIARLSSGNRIVKASDDVAALSVGTSLRTGVTTLKTALLNASQGSSLLQVADGALSQLSEILQRQKAIAVQAGSGSLGSTERGFLNQEFQNLTAEIDRIAGSTNFNGVVLLNGGLGTSTVFAADPTLAATYDPTAATLSDAGTAAATAASPIEAFLLTDGSSAAGTGTAGFLDVTDSSGTLLASSYESVNSALYGQFSSFKFSNVIYGAGTGSATLTATINGVEFVGNISDGASTALLRNGSTYINLGITTVDFTDAGTTQQSQSQIGVDFKDTVLQRVSIVDGVSFAGTSMDDVIGAGLGIASTRLSSNSAVISDFRYAGNLGAADTNQITVSINGQTFTATGVDDDLATGGTIVFQSADFQTMSLDITGLATGTLDDIRTDETQQATFINALNLAFSRAGGGLDFQIGATSADSLKVKLSSAASVSLFNGQALSVATSADASNAVAALDSAIAAVTSLRADVGALQSRFNFASANLQSSIQNQDAARGVLLDTDVAAESTAYATSQVQLQAGIAVLAQANQLPQNLLKLIS